MAALGGMVALSGAMLAAPRLDLAAAAFVDQDAVVDYSTKVELERDTEEKAVGDAHYVSVNASYSNPNDETDTTVRLYLWEYDESFDSDPQTFMEIRRPLSGVELVGFDGVEHSYALDGNPDTSVVVRDVSERDGGDDGPVSSRYLEMILTAGSSVSFDLGMTAPNGLHSLKGAVVEPVVQRSTDTDNRVVDDPVKVTWSGRFDWSDLVKLVDGSEDGAALMVGSPGSPDSPDTDMDFTFSAAHETPPTGAVWTDEIEIEDTLTLPAEVARSVGALSWKRGDGNAVIDSDGTPMAEVASSSGDVSVELSGVSASEIAGGDVAVTLSAVARNLRRDGDVLTGDIESLDFLSVRILSSNWTLSKQATASDQEATNRIRLTFVPAAGSGADDITLEDDVPVTLSDEGGLLVVDKGTPRPGEIYYRDAPSGTTSAEWSFSVSNHGREAVEAEVSDVLPQNVFLTDSAVSSLEGDGWDVSHVDVLFQQGVADMEAHPDEQGENFSDGGVTIDAGGQRVASAPASASFRLFRDETDADLSGTVSGTVSVAGTTAAGDEVEASGTFEGVDLARYESQSVTVPLSGGSGMDFVSSVSVTLDPSSLSGGARLSFGEDGLVVLGPKESPDSAGQRIPASPDSDASEEVAFSSTKYWQVALEDNAIYPMTDIAPGGAPRVSFDLYATPKTAGTPMRNVVVYVYAMVDDSWTWVGSQTGLLSVYAPSYSGELEASDIKADDGSDAGYAYKVPMSVWFDEAAMATLSGATRLQAIGVQVVGSGSSWAGTVCVRNMRYESDSAKGANRISKTVHIGGKATWSSPSYEVETTSLSAAVPYNVAYALTDACSSQDAAPIQILSTPTSDLNRGHSTISLRKTIAGRINSSGKTFLPRQGYEESLNEPDPLTQVNLTMLDRGDRAFYTVTLANEGNTTQDVRLMDANPLYGHYNFLYGNETLADNDPGWAVRYSNYSVGRSNERWRNTVPLRMLGLSGTLGYSGVVGNVPTHTDFVSHLVGDYSADGRGSEMTIRVRPGETLQQTFVLNMAEVGDYDLFEAAVRQAMTGGQAYSTVMNDPGGPQVQGPNYTFYPRTADPANTIFMKGHASSRVSKDYGVGATVTHCLPTRYGVNTFVAGAGVYKTLLQTSGDPGATYGESTEGVFANPDMVALSQLNREDDQYVIFGVTLTNDSTEGLPISSTYVDLYLSGGVRFVDLLVPAVGDYRTSSGEVLPRVVDGQVRLMRGYSLAYTASYSQMGYFQCYNPVDANILGSRQTRWFGANDWAKWTFYGATISRSSMTTTSGSTSVRVNLGGGGMKMPAYSSFTFYYLARLDSSYASSSIGAQATWSFGSSSSYGAMGWTSNEDSAYGNTLLFRPSADIPTNLKPYTGSSYAMGSISQYSGMPAVSSTVNFGTVGSYPIVGLSKAVVGRNSRASIEGEDGGVVGARMTNYLYDMHYFSADPQEVVTFMITVASDDVQGSGTPRTYTVTDTIPDGFEFLGVHEVVSGAYVVENNQDGRVDHYLGPLRTEGTISGTIKQSDGFVTYDADTIPSINRAIPSGGYYTFKSSGQNLTFDVTQTGDQATYILYSCAVTDETMTGSYTNTAQISGNYLNWDAMAVSNYYNSPLAIGENESRRISYEWQNVSMGAQPGGRGKPITASVTIQALPRYQDLYFTKQAAASYDKDLWSKNVMPQYGMPYTPPEVYYENGNSEAKSYDGRPLHSIVGTLAPDGRMGNILDTGGAGVPYSPVDGMHAVAWYRRDVVWRLAVKNESDNSEGRGIPADVSRLTEDIDLPFRVYGYALTLRDQYDAYVGTFSVDYRGTEDGFMPSQVIDAGYSSKVTGQETKRNRYSIDLLQAAKDAKAAVAGSRDDTGTDADGIAYYYREGSSYGTFGVTLSDPASPSTSGTIRGGLTLGHPLVGLPCGWYFDLYIYTEMTEDELDWYYNTATFDAIGESRSDWVTSIGTDGIYHYDRIVDSSGAHENGSTSRSDFIGTDLMGDAGASLQSVASLTRRAQAASGRRMPLTMEMICNLYQTQRYSEGTLSDIVMYSLLPGISGGVMSNEPGGSIVPEPDSFGAYVLRSDGTKAVIDPSHYEVGYSYDSLHGGRHPMTVNDPTLYHVDFSAAADESIWMGSDDDALVIEDVRSLRVAFDDSVTLSDGDRLFVDYEATVSDENYDEVLYRTVFGYIYTLTGERDGTPYSFRLYEDTTDGLVDVEDTGTVYVDKRDEDGKLVSFGKDDWWEFSVYRDSEMRQPICFRKVDDATWAYVDYSGVSSADATVVRATGSSTTMLTGMPFGSYYVREVTPPKGYGLTDSLSSGILLVGTGPLVEKRTLVLSVEDPRLEQEGTLTIRKVDESGDLISSGEATFVVPVSGTGATGTSRSWTPSTSAPAAPYMTFIDEGVQEGRGHVYAASEYGGSGLSVTDLVTDGGIITIEHIPYTDRYALLRLCEVSAPAGYVKSGPYSVASEGWEEHARGTHGVITWTRQDTATDDVIEVTDNDNDTRLVIAKQATVPSTRVLGSVAYRVYPAEASDTPLLFRRDGTYEGTSGVEMPLYVLNVGSGAVPDEDAVSDIETDNGYVMIAGLVDGTSYWGEEVRAPRGYALATDRFRMSARLSSVTTVTVRDAPEVGTLQIVKKGPANEVLSDGRFSFSLSGEDGSPVMVSLTDDGDARGTVYDVVADGGTESLETTTGSIFVRGLAAGRYVLTETECPAEWSKSDDVSVSVDLSRNGVPVNVTGEAAAFDDMSPDTGMFTVATVVDDYGTGSVSLTKERNAYDDAGHKTGTAVLDDLAAGFSLRDSDGDLVGVEVADDGSYAYAPDGSQTEMITEGGSLLVTGLPVGEYVLSETSAPDGYAVAADRTLTVTSSHHRSPLAISVVDERASGSVVIEKRNGLDELITGSPATFTISSAGEDAALRFSKAEDGTYGISDDGDIRVSTANGTAKVSGLALGDYVMREIVAPDGYSTYDGDIEFTVTDADADFPHAVKVHDPEAVIGTGITASASWKKIEEVDDPGNIGYGYYGRLSDREEGNTNFIVVDSPDDLVRYTISIGNLTSLPFKRVVAIDKLPSPDDTGVVNQAESRQSEFSVRVAETPDFRVTLVDGDGGEHEVGNDEYSIGFGDMTSFTEGDFNGLDNGRWVADASDALSFRIRFADDFSLPGGWSVRISFTGEIQDDAEPGAVAWNDFGYRYRLGNAVMTDDADGILRVEAAGDAQAGSLDDTRPITREPPKVGVMIPVDPEITKVFEGTDDAYEATFDIVDVTDDEEVVTSVTVANGETKPVPAHRVVNGEDNGGILESGHSYEIRERDSSLFSLAKVEGTGGSVNGTGAKQSFAFVQRGDTEVKATFTNVPATRSVSVRKAWEGATDEDVPDSVTIRLLEGGEDTGKTLTLSTDGQWQGSFDGLPVMVDGHEADYSVEEVPVDGYEAAYAETADGFVVTNTKAMAEDSEGNPVLPEPPHSVLDLGFRGGRSITDLLQTGDAAVLVAIVGVILGAAGIAFATYRRR